MNNKFLNYIFQKEKLFYLMLFIIYLVSFPILLLFVNESNKYLIKNIAYIPTIIYLVLGYIIPIWSFRQNYFKNMGNLYYSLPIKSVTIYKTKTYFHLVMNVLIYSITLMLGILILFLEGINLYYSNLFIFLGLADVIFISLFFFESFIASRCYNIFEAIILTLCYLVLPAFLLVACYIGLHVSGNNLNWSQVSFIGSLTYTLEHFVSRSLNNFGVSFNNYLPILLAFIISLFLHFLSIYRVNHLKIEMVGEKTDSIFSNKILVPIYLFILLLLGNYTIGWLSLVINALVILVALCVSIIRYRYVKYNIPLIITYLVSLGLTNLIAFLVVS